MTFLHSRHSDQASNSGSASSGFSSDPASSSAEQTLRLIAQLPYWSLKIA